MKYTSYLSRIKQKDKNRSVTKYDWIGNPALEDSEKALEGELPNRRCPVLLHPMEHIKGDGWEQGEALRERGKQ